MTHCFIYSFIRNEGVFTHSFINLFRSPWTDWSTHDCTFTSPGLTLWYVCLSFIHSFTGLIFHPSLHADLLIYVSTHRYINHGLIHFLTQSLVSALSVCSWHDPLLPFMTSFLPLESFSHSLFYPFILFYHHLFTYSSSKYFMRSWH